MMIKSGRQWYGKIRLYTSSTEQIMNKDLTATQNDYAHFLPALSGFYATYVGKQRFPDPVKGPILKIPIC